MKSFNWYTKLRQNVALTSLGVLCSFGLLAPAYATLSWKPLRPGLSYTLIQTDPSHPWKKVHAFKIDPKRYTLSLALANKKQAPTTVSNYAQQHQALIAVNGGFFSKTGQPIGLRITSGVVKQALHPTAWWGVFYLHHTIPAISSPRQYQEKPDTQFAIQGGPRLLINGDIPRLKSGYDQRTALGISADQQILIVVTEHNALATTELALLMRDSLKCQQAINLDGGSSTQLYAQIDNWQLAVYGLSTVSDAVIVKQREP
jgi:uncharacterized protein YigE (DUF2233 family)